MPPKGKGKDMSRMRAPSAPPPAASPTAAAPASAEAPSSQPASAPPSQRVPSPGARSGKPKGKDFSRMAAPPQPAPIPAAVPVAQPPPPVVPSQPPAADLRRQNAARIAAGMAPLGPGGRQGSVGDNKPTPAPVVPVRQPPPQVPVQNTSYAPPGQPQHQPLMPNAPPNFKPQQAVPQQPRQPPSMAPPSTASTNAVLQPPKREVPQATPRPEWSEGRLSTMQGTPTAASGYGKASLAPILGEKLQSLCKSIDPSYSLDAEVQERLVEMADGFVDKVTKDAIKLARHRGSTTMDVVDVALALKKGYNMDVPGLGPPSVPGANKSGGQIGGWLFADKVNVGEEEPPKKKSRPDGAAATAAAM